MSSSKQKCSWVGKILTLQVRAGNENKLKNYKKLPEVEKTKRRENSRPQKTTTKLMHAVSTIFWPWVVSYPSSVCFGCPRSRVIFWLVGVTGENHKKSRSDWRQPKVKKLYVSFIVPRWVLVVRSHLPDFELRGDFLAAGKSLGRWKSGLLGRSGSLNLRGRACQISSLSGFSGRWKTIGNLRKSLETLRKPSESFINPWKPSETLENL